MPTTLAGPRPAAGPIERAGEKLSVPVVSVRGMGEDVAAGVGGVLAVMAGELSFAAAVDHLAAVHRVEAVVAAVKAEALAAVSRHPDAATVIDGRDKRFVVEEVACLLRTGPEAARSMLVEAEEWAGARVAGAGANVGAVVVGSRAAGARCTGNPRPLGEKGCENVATLCPSRRAEKAHDCGSTRSAASSRAPVTPSAEQRR